MTEVFSAAFWANLFWQQKPRLIDWVPVLFGLGIGVYFALPAEPHPTSLIAVIVISILCIGLVWSKSFLVRIAILIPLVISLGAGWASLRAHYTALSVLGFHYYGAIQGRIMKIDRSASDVVRITLDQVVLSRMPLEKTPKRLRISLHGQQGFFNPTPGMTVMLIGHLSPPAGAAELSGFNFKRHYWFLRLGGLRYTRFPVLMLSPAHIHYAVGRARIRISNHI